MTAQEAKQAFDELKAQGETEETILGVLYVMFQNDEIDVNELGDLVSVLGYELTDEFKNMSPEDQKTKGFEEDQDEAAEGVSKEEVEDAKEITPEEDKDSDKDEEAEEAEDTKSEDEDAEDDESKAKRLFGFDK